MNVWSILYRIAASLEILTGNRTVVVRVFKHDSEGNRTKHADIEILSAFFDSDTPYIAISWEKLQEAKWENW